MLSYLMLSLSLSLSTHTHTHTQRERERERVAAIICTVVNVLCLRYNLTAVKCYIWKASILNQATVILDLLATKYVGVLDGSE